MVDVDLDLLGDQQSTGLEGLVPGDPEVLAVEPGAGREDGAVATPRVADVTLERDVERHPTGDAVDREVTVHRAAVAPPLD